MIDSENQLFITPKAPLLHSLPRDCSASLHMASIPGLCLDWGLNPILLTVLQFKLYWKQMLPNQVEELAGIWSSIKCWLGMDEVFVIKRKQKQTSCLESPEGKGGTAVRKSSTAAPCQARKYKSDKFIHHCSPETKGWAHLGLGKQELTPEILVSKRELFHHWYLCNSLFGGEIA